jgi:hypothetical protein
MSDEVISPSATLIPQPIEEWVAYTFDRFSPFTTPSRMNQIIEKASSADARWNGTPGGTSEEKWLALKDTITGILNAAVLDFREAYGAALDERGKTDKTLVPTSCLSYIDATFLYNVALCFGLYYLNPDGVTKNYVTEYFSQAWKDASVYRRAIASSRRIYREEIAASQSASGTPFYTDKAATSARTL